MHELSIAMAILDEVGEVAAKEGATSVRSVRLQVGELSSVVNDALVFAWDLASEGTVAQGSSLLIERVAVEIHCPACARSRAPISANYLACAVCGTPSSQIVRGRELLVVAMEVADADSSDGSSAFDPEEKRDARAGAPAPV